MKVIYRIWRLSETRVGIELLGQLKMNNEETVKSFLDTWVEVLGPRPTLNNALCITFPGQNRQAN